MQQQKYQQNINEIRDRVESELRARFPNTYNFERKEVAALVGCTVGHMSNCQGRGKPIIESVSVTPESRKIVYAFNLVVDYLVTQQAARIKPILGRPTKASKMVGGDA